MKRASAIIVWVFLILPALMLVPLFLAFFSEEFLIPFFASPPIPHPSSYLFTVDIKYRKDLLYNRKITEDLREEFEQRNISLSQNATIEIKKTIWNEEPVLLINDRDREQRFIVEELVLWGERLNIYTFSPLIPGWVSSIMLIYYKHFLYILFPIVAIILSVIAYRRPNQTSGLNVHRLRNLKFVRRKIKVYRRVIIISAISILVSSFILLVLIYLKYYFKGF